MASYNTIKKIMNESKVSIKKLQNALDTFVWKSIDGDGVSVTEYNANYVSWTDVKGKTTQVPKIEVTIKSENAKSYKTVTDKLIKKFGGSLIQSDSGRQGKTDLYDIAILVK